MNIDDCFSMMQELIGNEEVKGNLQMNVVCRVTKSCSTETVCFGNEVGDHQATRLMVGWRMGQGDFEGCGGLVCL